MSDTSENITDELNKLLEIKKCDGKNKACNCKSCSSSSEHHKNCECYKCTSLSSSDIDKKSSSSKEQSSSKEKNSSLSDGDVAVALSELRNDYIKMLKILTSVTKEIKQLQECVSEINSDKSSSESSSSSSKSSVSSYQEHIDKILSTKLDELTIKVENKISDMDKFTMNTRRIAIAKNKSKLC
jgi:vacuolar-type H+-ATPase subunit I/STV1